MKELTLKKVFLLIAAILFLLITPLWGDEKEKEKEKSLSAAERVWPQGGLFYQTHLGPTVSLGAAYNILEHNHDGSVYGPYVEAGLGTHGYSANVGWIVGVGGVILGGSLSYAKINDNHSYFNKGNYYGLGAKFMFLRLGIYHEPKLNDNKVSFSIGIGF